MRLGPFMRLGVILTVWWMALGSLYMADRSMIGISNAKLDAASECAKIAGSNWKFADACWDQARKVSDSEGWQYNMESALELAAVVAALLWPLGIAVYWSARWVLSGRSQKEVRTT